MKGIRGALGALFGPSRNDQFIVLLKQLADTVVECSEHFRKTGGKDLKGIIDYEHKADAIVDEIHELLDNSFIMRFDIPDTMRLTDDLDNVIDGMRKVAIHIDVYKPHMPALRPEAQELIELGNNMALQLQELVGMLGESRLSLSRVRDTATQIDDGEGRADRIVSDVERKLVTEFSAAGANTLGFIAWHQMFHLLEQMTDDANHCAKLILSLARKEA